MGIDHARLLRAARLLGEAEDWDIDLGLVARGEQVCAATFVWPYGYSSEYTETYELGQEFNDLRPEIVLLLQVQEDSLLGRGAWPLAQKALGLAPGEVPVGWLAPGKMVVLRRRND
jgi:hypothetical protein